MHEGAAALFDPDQAALFEFAHRAADGVAVDGKLGGQLGLGRQLFARRIELVADIVRKRLADLPPDGDAGTSFDHRVCSCCHISFMKNGSDCAP
jgi:hypothetical protein